MVSIGTEESEITAACETLTRNHPALVGCAGMFDWPAAPYLAGQSRVG